MRLIKAAAYALLGFVLYELFLGISEDTQKPGKKSSSSSGSKRRLNEGRGRPSGSSSGRTEHTGDARGATGSHTVGRGAI